MDYDVNSHLNMKLQITKTEIQKINVTNLFYEFLHPKETSEVEELPCG